MNQYMACRLHINFFIPLFLGKELWEEHSYYHCQEAMIWICLKKPYQAPPEDECCWGIFLKGYSNYFTHILCFLCIWRNPIDHYRVSCARQHAGRCAWRGWHVCASLSCVAREREREREREQGRCAFLYVLLLYCWDCFIWEDALGGYYWCWYVLLSWAMLLLVYTSCCRVAKW
jgi:hypothetical protein